jgi:hypothetical protein
MKLGWFILLFGVLRMVFLNDINSKYLKSIGVAIDDLGGTILFGTVRHTISANIGYRQHKGNKAFIIIANIVDYKYFFGKNHCYCLALREGMIDDTK